MGSTQLVQVGESTAVAAVASGNSLTETQVDLLKSTICAGSTDDELALFVNAANRMGLDPFARQIFAVKRWNADQRREVMSIQVSIDGYRLIADRTGRYAPGPENTFVEGPRGELISATAHVLKLVAGVWHTVSATARWSEYVQTKKDGGTTAMWARMPYTMLGKCAEALALRKAFPAELSGVYTSDEMGQADPVSEPTARLVDTRTGEIIERPSPAVDAEYTQELLDLLDRGLKCGTVDECRMVREAFDEAWSHRNGRKVGLAVKERLAQFERHCEQASDLFGDDDPETERLAEQARGLAAQGQTDGTPAEVEEG